MLQLIKLHAKLQLESCTFGKKLMYHIQSPSVTLEVMDCYHINYNQDIQIINTADSTILTIDTAFNDGLRSYLNSANDVRIASLEHEISQLREIINNITERN